MVRTAAAVIVLLAPCLGGWGADIAPAAKQDAATAAQPAPVPTTISGIVTACSTAGTSGGATITVAPKGPAAQPLTLHITDKTSFTVAKAASTFDALHLDDTVSVRFVGTDAIAVTVEPPAPPKKRAGPPKASPKPKQ